MFLLAVMDLDSRHGVVKTRDVYVLRKVVQELAVLALGASPAEPESTESSLEVMATTSYVSIL